MALGCSSASSTTEDPFNVLDNQIGYSGVLVAHEFLVGENRFPFRLIDLQGEELRNATVKVQFHFVNNTDLKPRSEHQAEWHNVEGTKQHLHSDGETHQHRDTSGIYVINKVSFDEPGFWTAEFIATTKSGDPIDTQRLAFTVITNSAAPQVGENVPPTENSTIYDVASFTEISTRREEDKFHEYSVAEALQLNQPFIVLFSSPEFCMNATCGLITDVAAEMHARFRDSINMIHIEPWDLNLARSQAQLIPNKQIVEWHLPSEPWIFLINADGIVEARFEGLASSLELEHAIKNVLTD